MLSFLVHWAVLAIALLVAVRLVPGVAVNSYSTLAIAALVVGLVNAFVRPVLVLLSLPITVLTLGLFYLVINIAMVALAEWIAPNFSIDGFWTYVGVVFIVWVVNWVGNQLEESLAKSRRRPGLI